jgi:predicted DNA-binding antitoxin AbrB/MazE fold protein
MSTVEAIYASGVFKPLTEINLPENQRVRLVVERVAPVAVASWLAEVAAFQQQLVANHGVLPDSTPEIAADRRRHE